MNKTLTITNTSAICKATPFAMPHWAKALAAMCCSFCRMCDLCRMHS